MQPEPNIEFAPATRALAPAMARLLQDSGLPVGDLESADLSGFEVARNGAGDLVGVAGLEVHGVDALLRSIAVVPEARDLGLGRLPVARREAAAQHASVATIYLLTMSAGDFFRSLGYADVSRDSVPTAIAQHAQFRSLCPASAKCLAKKLL